MIRARPLPGLTPHIVLLWQIVFNTLITSRIWVAWPAKLPSVLALRLAVGDVSSTVGRGALPAESSRGPIPKSLRYCLWLKPHFFGA